VNANRHREERDARFINDRVHANIQNDGTFSVVPRIYGGVVTRPPSVIKNLLIRPRMNFVPELLKSVENL